MFDSREINNILSFVLLVRIAKEYNKKTQIFMLRVYETFIYLKCSNKLIIAIQILNLRGTYT